MIKPSLVALCLCLTGLSAWSQTAPIAPAAQMQADAPQATAENAADNIVVLGQRPGPGLWKVSKGEHVLWVFGLYSPLPKNMEWRSQQVENVMRHSQEFIGQPSANAKVGFFRGLTMLPFAIGVTKNPDGAVLRDLLPADIYARWLPLRKKYLNDDDSLERERPIFVADKLFRAGLAQAGLSRSREVSNAIETLLKKHQMKTTWPEVRLELDDPVAMLRQFKKTPLDDVACFTKTVARLELDLDAMRVRAHAWAKGQLAAIQKLDFADHESTCDAAILDSALTKSRPALQAIDTRLRDAWLAAAENALATNASSVALLKLQDILDPHGYVAALRAKGYTVDDPD